MNKRRILLYGDSNTWGLDADTGSRYDDDFRWTMKLAKLLGDDYMVVEEGLCGRTTVFDDPLFEGLNGFTHLSVALASHSPLDMLVIMLGTNDCKQRFSATADNIALGVERLVLKARSCDVFKENARILIVAPIIIGAEIYNTPSGGRMGAECAEKSQKLPQLLKQTADLLGCEFLDSNDYVTPTTVDYMHFDKKSQGPFSRAMYNVIVERGI